MDADRTHRMKQLENVIDWLTEMQQWIAGDAYVAEVEGDMDSVVEFEAESDVVLKLRGAAQFEFDEMRKLESRLAHRKLQEWEQATQRRNEVERS